MLNSTERQRKYRRNQYADNRQAELYKKFPATSFLGSERAVDHTIQWITFFRRNFHRCAKDYLQIKLHLYQSLMLYLMGISTFFVVIASRASAKSFIIALYACIKCILYPHSQVVLASATKGQSKLLVSEKIEKELMSMSPVLKREVKKIVDNQNSVIVRFWNESTITVVPASDNARGYRSTDLVREEFRQIKKSVDDSVLSPFQIVRQAAYMNDDYYANIPELREESTNIYISSSWIDNGHWMWNIVDQAFKDMLNDEPSYLLAFDESIALKHRIKTQKQYQIEKKKQDPMTWKIEFLNARLKENEDSFFSYELIEKNQVSKAPFYPRKALDVKTGKKNLFDIPKQKNEVRIISCDMAFIQNKKNDNSVYSCMRGLPECTTYSKGQASEIIIDNGYRRIVPYMESAQGGDISYQAMRIRQLYEDFNADYIVLDIRNAGIAIYDLLAKVMYDEERGIEYSPLKCMNDDGIADRIKIEGAKPCIYAISASQKLNSDIAIDFRRVLDNRRIDLLIPFEKASEEILPNIKEYTNALDAGTQIFYERPFLETQTLIYETTALVYEKKAQTGAIVISEQGDNRKDRYTSVSYGSWFFTQLERDLGTSNDDYAFDVFIN